ncbi:MAG: hemerythrin domain-containing protein [Pseudomonadales bacterium]
MMTRNSAKNSVEQAIVFEDDLYTFSREGPKRNTAGQGNAWVGIVETLYSEHGYILSLLDTLEQQVSKLKPGKIPDYHLLLEIVDYLTHYPDQFHHPREDLLFAGLLKREKKFQARLDRLQREHETLHFYNDKLFNELTHVVNGRAVDRAALLHSINRYIAGYRKHIDYESREIFPLAKGVLTAADLEKIDAKTRYIDDPLFGSKVQAQYRRLGRNMGATVESVGEELIAREFSTIESMIETLSQCADTLVELKNTMNAWSSGSLEEQFDTVKAHTACNNGPDLVFLPLALLKNYRRHMQEGFGEIKGVLARKKTQPE